jgi:hypothetical protein
MKQERIKIYKTEEANKTLIAKLEEAKELFLQLDDFLNDWQITFYTPDAQQYNQFDDDKERLRIVFYNSKYDKISNTYLFLEDLDKDYDNLSIAIAQIFKAVTDKLQIKEER